MAGDSTGGDRRPFGKRAWLAAAAALCLAIALFLVWQTRAQTFYADEWAFYVRAAGFDRERLLSPHLGNLIFGTVIVYKAVLSLTGASSHLSLRLLWVCLDITCAGLFFALMRTRVGNFAALVPTILLTVFGAAWEFFGGSLGITAMLCVAAGLGALLAIDRRARWADGLACLLLMVSLSTLSTGLAFAAGAAALLLIQPDRWRRIWVAAIPILLYAAWALWARKYGESGITVQTLASVPAAIVASLASVSAALFGAFRLPGVPEPGASNLVIFANESAGTLIGAVLAGSVIWKLSRRSFEPRLIPPFAMLLVYWGSLALVSPPRDPNTGRYQYAAAIFLLLLFGELWRGWRPSRGPKVAIAVLGLAALVPNAINLGYATELVRSVSEQDRAKLAVVDALRGQFPPETVIEPPGANIGAELVISARDYFRASKEFGSPADSIEELPGTGILPRQAADREFVYLLGIQAEPTPASRGRGCLTIPPGEIGSGGIRVPAAGVSIQPEGRAQVTVGLRRFSENFLKLEPLAGDGPFRVRIPADGVSKRWWMALESSRSARVCPLR
ncbi:MAG TPA: hypothetical protein VHR65_05890 [Solirubrobacterales bacterium]|jgi:hypothetical protein|nr:hypothetical protein [Solirubrobacterales bacterium]